MFKYLVAALMSFLWFCDGNSLLAFTQRTHSESDPSLPVAVDPRIEAISIVFRLIDANEYNQPSSESAYSRAVMKHFSKHKQHEALLMASRLREDRGIAFDAVASFATHLRDLDTCDFLVPLEPWPETLDSRWDVASAQAFAKALEKFVRDTEFSTFWISQRTFREAAEESMRKMLAEKPLKVWIESYFGEKIPEGSVVVVGLLLGGCNYGTSVRFPDGKVLVFPTIGVSTWDQKGLPVFPESVRETVVHEFCHPYVNPLVDKHLKQLLPAGEVLHKARTQTMAIQAYGEPRTVLYESLVRASVAHLFRVNEGTEPGLAQQKSEISKGFLWTSTLMAALEQFEADRKTFPSFQSFMPVIVKALDSPDDSMKTIIGQVPQVISEFPTDGSVLTNRDVRFRIEFDRPMDSSSKGLSFDSNCKYEVVEPGKFDVDGKVYQLTLRFEPGSVKTWINRNNMGWCSIDGYAAQERIFSFTIEK